MNSEENYPTLPLSSQSDNIYIIPDAHETHFFLFNVFVNPTTILLFLAGNILCLLVAICFLAVYRSAKSGRQNGKEEETEPRKILTQPGGWVRPVSNTEMYSASAAILGTGSTATVLWLSSLQSIKPEDVKQALSIITQRIHVLQLCVAWRWFRPWLRRMKNVVVDFSVDTGDAMSVYYQQMRTPYNISQGPLWRARLVPQPQAADRHQAVLVLTIHHIITDGFTNMLISRDFMEVLNAIMTGRGHNTPTRHNIPAITNELLRTRDYIYCLREVLLTTYKSLARMFIFSHPETKVAFTKVLCKDFSAETTQELLRHCKEANVSIHSSIVAAAFLALLRTAQKHLKVNKDSLRITYDDSVNMRRFFPSIYKESVGFHVSFCRLEHTVCNSDAESKDNFWKLARRIHCGLHHFLDVNKAPLLASPVSWILAALEQVNYVLTRLGYKNALITNMTISNMGNLKQLLPSHYDNGPVAISSLLRSVACEFLGCPFLINFHTLDGRFYISLDSYINNVTEDFANNFFSYLTNYVADIAHCGTINCL